MLLEANGKKSFTRVTFNIEHTTHYIFKSLHLPTKIVPKINKMNILNFLFKKEKASMPYAIAEFKFAGLFVPFCAIINFQ